MACVFTVTACILHCNSGMLFFVCAVTVSYYFALLQWICVVLCTVTACFGVLLQHVFLLLQYVQSTVTASKTSAFVLLQHFKRTVTVL